VYQGSGTPGPVVFPSDVDLTGIWDSYADGYVVSQTTLKYDDGSDGKWGMSFAGTIKYISAYGTGTGVIVIEYTEPPSVSYTTAGTSDYEGIYYKVNGTRVRFANVYDTTNTETPNLATAIAKFSQANESTFISNWNVAGNQDKQPNNGLDMGALRGNWQGDDDLSDMYLSGQSTWLRITDQRLIVHLGPISTVSRAYAGAIVDRTDPSADAGFIYIKFIESRDRGYVQYGLDAEVNDYYVIRWYKDNGKTRFSVYNDHEDVLSNDLETLKTHTTVNPYFLEADDEDYAGENGGLLASMGGAEYVYVGFTKQ
jgi:hypothetical protein